MPKITFIEADGREFVLEGKIGDTVMETAIDNDIEGILAQCGGGMACATCHCFIDEAWMEQVGIADDAEDDMLDFAAIPKQANSRLSCQISITAKLEGLIVRLPEEQ